MNEPHDPNVTADIPQDAADPVTTIDHAQALNSTDGSQPGSRGAATDLPSIPGYQVLHEIAQGGMGRVLAAFDLGLDRTVAIKVLLPGANADRFVRESKITARLPHPGIPPVYALGTLADGSPFLAMKLIGGQTLAEEMKTADRPRLLQAFTQVCQAVGFAHSRGVIHRDLKPSNVMVGAFGEVQVMDWGLARELARRADEPPGRSEPTEQGAGTPDSPDNTVAGQVMGTPAYMAPEQARGEATDARADVFALGGILCAILTGEPPFLGKSSLEVIQRAGAADLAEAFTRLDDCQADADLVSLCRRCLEPSSANRPENGQVVADGLTAYLNSVQERLQAAERERAVAVAREAEQRKRRRVQLALAAVVLLAILAAGVGAVWYFQDLAARSQQRERLAADLQKQLDDLEGHRRQLHGLLADRQHANALMSDIAGWKLQLDQLGESWERANAIRRAGGQLIDGYPAEQVTQQEVSLRDDLEDWKIARQLDGIRLESGVLVEGKLNPTRAVSKYPGVFSGLNLDVMNQPAPQVAEQIRRSRIRFALVAALDHWASVTTNPRLLEVARLVDPDPWGDRVRNPAIWSDRVRLLAFAGEGVPAGASSALVLLLATKVNAHDSRAAATLVRQAILAHPRDFWLHYELGNMAKDVTERMGSYNAALALRADSAVVYYNLGWALHAKQDADGASRCYRKALELDPKLAHAFNGLGVVLRDQKDIVGAVRSFERAIELDPDMAPAHHNLGWVLYLQRDYDAAIERFNKAVRLDPSLALTHNGLGSALLAKQDVNGAIQCFRRAIKLEPDLALPHYNLGVALRRQGKFADALKSFQKADELGSSGVGWNAPTAERVKECQRLIELERLLPDILQGKRQPKDAAEQLELAKLCMYLQHYAQAARFSESALSADPTLAVGWVRYDGACWALLAAAGTGEDAAKLDENEKTRLRRFALAALRTELTDFRNRVAKDPQQLQEVKGRLLHWQKDSDLASIRDAAALAKLPADEQKAFTQLWADAAALLKQADQ